jgi:flagellar biosynthesis/type III secretory pathway chaperone
MSNDWKPIAEHLRQELSDYGALLSLYDQQQRGLFARQPDTVLRLSTEIQAQVERVSEARRRRERVASEFAVSNGMAPDSTIRSLLSVVEKDARPLFEALISEINLLLHRVRRTHRQNHTLLSKALAMHRETLQLLRPNSFIKTYSPSGVVNVTAGRSSSTLCAAG